MFDSSMEHGTINKLKLLKYRTYVSYKKLTRSFIGYKLKNCEPYSIDLNDVRERTLSYVQKMKSKNGMYFYSYSRNTPILYASVYAALTRYLYGDYISDEEKNDWINYILMHQEEDGLFKDKRIANKLAEKVDWWGWRHLTVHCLMALKAFDVMAPKEFRFLEVFKDTNFVVNWLESRNWHDPNSVSNEIQNYANFLQYIRDFKKENWAQSSLNSMFDWLDEKQNPENGFWYGEINNKWELSEAIQTTYHLLLPYFYDKREVNHLDKIIDNCLAMQNKFGGFGIYPNSGACEDIDTIDILVRAYLITDYRREDIKKALERSLRWILINMNTDGGFVYRRFEPRKYGHDLMYARTNESEMFSTWFRTLSIAYISLVIPIDVEYNFIDCPGYQFM